jgi:hypothetical protein
MNDPEQIKQEIRHMIKSVGHTELEDMFGDVINANYTFERARRRGIRRLRR